jgi:hypothetical protein
MLGFHPQFPCAEFVREACGAGVSYDRKPHNLAISRFQQQTVDLDD